MPDHWTQEGAERYAKRLSNYPASAYLWAFWSSAHGHMRIAGLIRLGYARAPVDLWPD